MNNYKVSADRLEIFTKKIFQKAGLEAGQAQIVAELLVHADIRGVTSHGVLRIKQYVDKIRGGGVALTSTYPVVAETENTAVIDARGGLGAIASNKAVEIACEKARVNRISLVSVRNSNHFGMAGHWAMKLAGEEYIGFACSNTAPAMAAPPGIKMPFIGNNPFAFAFSAGRKYPEVCVDMATSLSALGKARAYVMEGKPIPEGWILDKEGKPTTDLSKYGMLVPMAGHKGFGIAFVVELFATLLSGGKLSEEMNSQDLPDKPELASQSFGCINISAFRDLKNFREDAECYIEKIKALPVQEGVKEAKYPGEIEFVNKQKNLKEGIILPENLVIQLKEIARDLDLSEEDINLGVKQEI